jgi:hypothetical protein
MSSITTPHGAQRSATSSNEQNIVSGAPSGSFAPKALETSPNLKTKSDSGLQDESLEFCGTLPEFVFCWISLAVTSWIGFSFFVQRHFYPVSMGLRNSFVDEKPDFCATLG